MAKQPTEGSALMGGAGSARSQDIWYLRTTSRKWASVVVVAVVSSFAQIPAMAWQTLQPLMLDDGAFQCGTGTRTFAMEQLDSIFNVGLGLSAAASLPAGLLFDVIGPRHLATLAALASMVGYLVLALALQYPCSSPGVVWISLFSFVAAPAQALAANAYLYILPENAFAVSAITNSSFVLAQAMGLVGAVLQATGLTSHGFFYIMSGVTGVALLVFYTLLPSHDDFSALQAEELAKQSGAKAGGPPEKPERSLTRAIAHVRTSLYDAGTLVCRSPSFGAGGVILVIHVFALYMQQTFFIIEQFHYYEDLFDEATADHLVNLYAFIFATTGVPICLLYGAIGDNAPMWAAVLSWDAMAALFCATTILPQLWAQYVGMIALTLLTNVYFLAAPPFVMCYSPPELFGTLFGALMSLMGLLQIGLVTLEDTVSDAFMPREDQEDQRVVGKLVFWTVLILVASVGNMCVWRRSPPPERGSVTLASIRALQQDDSVKGIIAAPSPESPESPRRRH